MSKQSMQTQFVLPMLAVVSITTIVTFALYAGLSGAAENFCDQETTPSGYAGLRIFCADIYRAVVTIFV